MKKKRILGYLSIVTLSTLALAACGNDKGADKDKDKEAQTESVLPIKVANDGKAIDGQTLEVGVVMDTQFKGLFLWELYTDAYDAEFMSPSHQSLFSTDADFVITNDGIAGLELDQDAKKATITILKDAKWSDGEPLTADDIIYPYEIIGHKDYTGVRYDDTMTRIVGMEEYHDGKADTISGIKKIDDKTVEISYKEVNPGMLQAGGGVWSYAAPKHQLKDIAIKDLESAAEVRKNPVTLGPYKMSKIVAGESVEYVPNEHYYEETGGLDKIVFTAVPSASSVEALKAKKYDFMLSMPTDTFPSYEKIEGYENLGRQELSYTYIGFKLGKWDDEKKEVATDPNAKMADKSLRQAMGYAINNDQVGEKFYNGLRSNASTLIPPVFAGFHDSSIEGYSQDKDKAKKLLADAGYKDTDNDGFVEDKDGKPLVIKFASMDGGETAQPLADYYMQEWKEIGLNVELSTGRLIDFQSFYDKVQNDDSEIDVYQAAWGTGSDPSPSGLYSRNAQYNYTRFSSEENDKLLAAIDSADSFDPEKRKEAFSAWQEYAKEEAFVIPTLYRNEVLPVNQRVTGLDWSNDNYDLWAKIGVSEDARK
ncbi:oligopeptide ABC transporter substrate-binding protein [Vagococcus zengguangii]|uniref:Oligopeptide ABC transporter substrate-binding protein n=1 Tax=Vagococcus zengguangii TaxID=2571750 RepID=A0A4D7CT14_9ENTE|nr:oligopeptide ABC transporter substrate-binding protein [Vagococcus zengguangii]QCI85912.1 oligopeptide ABC transporter substrate-binding protein [Vagococcus zengguangii]TLG78402.1 oligopeptide ABC transporter substrate-binding protein [Vagococcus zengguangii]